MMMLNSMALLVIAAAVSTTSALECSKDDVLSKYRLSDIPLVSTSKLDDTPPSKTNTTWYFNLCQAEGELPADCPKNSQICGVQTVLLAGEDPIVSQVISWGQGLSYTVENDTESGFVVKMGETNWGSNTVDSTLKFNCAKDDDLSVEWDTKALSLSWNTPFACLKDSKKPPPEKPKDGEKNKEPADDSWGWFTWLFIILVLAFGVYIIMGAWLTFTRSPADFSDAVHDFVDTLKSLAQGVPSFVSEIFGRAVGRGDRGGYSAV